MSNKFPEVSFDENAAAKVKNLPHGSNWPVVYIINNDNEAYIGETVDASQRTSQHYMNETRRVLKEIHIISDDNFNKSVILDLESYLIKYMSADGKFRLQNNNHGLVDHNYFNREEYEKNFSNIWNELKREGLTVNSIRSIENSDMFKYSPYKALSSEQAETLTEILQMVLDDINAGTESTMLVEGGAGTGKTVLAVFMVKLFSEIGDTIPADDPDEMNAIDNLAEEIGHLKVGLVLPQSTLQKTIGDVFENIHGLSRNMVLAPTKLLDRICYPEEKYDLLIVDEAHRLNQRKALISYPAYDKMNKALGLNEDGTALDWVIKCSRRQILFYDPMQAVHPADINEQYIRDTVNSRLFRKCVLTSEMRCEGGYDYIEYVKQILSDDPPAEMKSFGAAYDLRLYEDANQMIADIKEKDAEFGLCRNVAGYAWPWKTKNNHSRGMYDMEFDGHKYMWNSTYKDWINAPGSVNEIGCIHTIQGYDLNYTGVIFGNEICYNKDAGRIEAVYDSYYDTRGRIGMKNDPAGLRKFVLNIYMTLMTRGIKGTYIYVCNDALREYVRPFFDVVISRK